MQAMYRPMPGLFHSEIQQCGGYMDKQKILIVDQEPRVISALERFLRDKSYEIFTAENGHKSLEILHKEKIDLAVVEAQVEDMDGITLLTHVQAEKIQTAILIMTSLGSAELGEQLIKAGAVSVLDKPIAKDRFLTKVKRYMPSQYMWKDRLESFLEDNYTNPDLKFEDIMHYFKFSKTYGYELFKKYFGESFRICLRNVRMAKAEEALKHTSDSISEIAYRCGFTSLSTFSKVFKAKYGNNPTTYRKFHFRNYLSMWFYVLIDF